MQLVIAALVAATFFIERPTADDPRRPFYHVALALCLVAFAVGLGVLVFPFGDSEGFPLNQIGNNEGTVAKSFRGRLTLDAGVGFAFTFIGLRAWYGWRTVFSGFLLAGTILLLMAAFPHEATVNPLYDLTAEAGPARNFAYTAVAGIGAAALLIFGYNEWERPGSEEEEDRAEELPV